MSVNDGAGCTDTGLLAPSPTSYDMRVIPPPESGVNEGLAVISTLKDKLIKSKEDLMAFRDKHKSIRYIQADRIEVFVQASEKPSTAFDTLLLNQQDKNTLIDYAISQARKDERIASADLKFDNFSLLVTWESCQEQAAHLDLLLPNWQFGLVVTDGAPGTLYWDTGKPSKERNLQNLRDLSLPDEVTKKLEGMPEALTLVEDFGALLGDYGSPRMAGNRALQAGTLMSLPGGVIHAGPPAHGFRVVLFFSASPKDQISDQIVAYHPDTQYTRPGLWGEIISYVWDVLGKSSEGRKAVLRLFADMINRSKHKFRQVYAHFPKGHLNQFAQAVELENFPRGMSLTRYIEFCAKNKDMSAAAPHWKLCSKGVITLDMGDGLIKRGLVYRHQGHGPMKSHGGIGIWFLEEGNWVGFNEQEDEGLYRLDNRNEKLMETKSKRVLARLVDAPSLKSTRRSKRLRESSE
uniref:Uncharacterized protein n=1 Tax=Grammatophora oceanica TaxID=210454 RepID=A0A7S1VHK1_9STRA|mmetsp:Transcript_46743/g.69512  ORF Transcript_46743/g.69512 Transcript_46743/m.69512 type:complete len:463 (+) Transcript_46743:190-1578(+)|eukprot:CAMPEP_0194037652 /NCGR_PEP_ID=MMETSP0009_2-20130614/9994_1 /TAXON_ID=210454 /ORGANISM="Grammatophora oceanica, Strain CCMP 410" /LENGTH=462 /DNA_ID=CAMNT_0038679901 /DNA_START=109 /DNA_END=1497 /DNA_ORIENTATION=+